MFHGTTAGCIRKCERASHGRTRLAYDSLAREGDARLSLCLELDLRVVREGLAEQVCKDEIAERRTRLTRVHTKRSASPTCELHTPPADAVLAWQRERSMDTTWRMCPPTAAREKSRWHPIVTAARSIQPQYSEAHPSRS